MSSRCYQYNPAGDSPCFLAEGHQGPHTWERPPRVTVTAPHWWSDHNNLAMTASFMHAQDHSVEDIIYMLEKPWKHNDDYNLAQAESELPS